MTSQTATTEDCAACAANYLQWWTALTTDQQEEACVNLLRDVEGRGISFRSACLHQIADQLRASDDYTRGRFEGLLWHLRSLLVERRACAFSFDAVLAWIASQEPPEGQEDAPARPLCCLCNNARCRALDPLAQRIRLLPHPRLAALHAFYVLARWHEPLPTLATLTNWAEGRQEVAPAWAATWAQACAEGERQYAAALAAMTSANHDDEGDDDA